MMRAMLAMLLLVSPALAHEAPSGWSYAAECCHNQDCAPLPEDQTPKPLDGGDWLLKTGEVVPKSKVKFSPDGLFHLCRFARPARFYVSTLHRRDHKMKVIDKAKDYYLVVIDWIAAHPHIVFWAGVGAVIAALAV